MQDMRCQAFTVKSMRLKKRKEYADMKLVDRFLHWLDGDRRIVAQEQRERAI